MIVSGGKDIGTGRGVDPYNRRPGGAAVCSAERCRGELLEKRLGVEKKRMTARVLAKKEKDRIMSTLKRWWPRAHLGKGRKLRRI